MPAGGAIISGLGILGGIGEAIWGASEKKKYQAQLDALQAQRPKYAINPEEYDIQHLAESRAGQGMGASAKAQLQANADRNLATLSNAALMGGADANSIGNIADKTQNAYNQNAIYDDQARLQNLSNLQNVWARQSANRDKEWQINQEQPWKDRMASTYGQLQGANNLFMGGLNLAGGGLMSLGGKLMGGGGSGGGGQMGGGDMGGGYAMGMNSGGGGSMSGVSSGNLGMGGYGSGPLIPASAGSSNYSTPDDAPLIPYGMAGSSYYDNTGNI